MLLEILNKLMIYIFKGFWKSIIELLAKETFLKIIKDGIQNKKKGWDIFACEYFFFSSHLTVHDLMLVEVVQV